MCVIITGTSSFGFLPLCIRDSMDKLYFLNISVTPAKSQIYQLHLNESNNDSFLSHLNQRLN